MAYNNVEPLVFYDSRIIFRNFKGEASQFNRAGSRTFNVVISDPQVAQALANDGWNVKMRPARDEGDAPLYHLPVAVRFGSYPPSIYLISNGKKRELSEETISCLDYVNIKSVDLKVNPYTWDDNGVSRIKAYLHSMYVVQKVDEFESKYAACDDVPDMDVPFME